MKYSIKEYSNFIDFQEANCYYGFIFMSHIHRIKVLNIYCRKSIFLKLLLNAHELVNSIYAGVV